MTRDVEAIRIASARALRTTPVRQHRVYMPSPMKPGDPSDWQGLIDPTTIYEKLRTLLVLMEEPAADPEEIERLKGQVARFLAERYKVDLDMTTDWEFEAQGFNDATATFKMGIYYRMSLAVVSNVSLTFSTN